MYTERTESLLSSDLVKEWQKPQTEGGQNFKFTAEKEVAKGNAERPALRDISNLLSELDRVSDKRLSRSPVAKKGRKMESELDTLAAQRAQNSEENRRLQLLLQEKTSLLQQAGLLPALIKGQGSASGGVKVLNTALASEKGKAVAMPLPGKTQIPNSAPNGLETPTSNPTRPVVAGTPRAGSNVPLGPAHLHRQPHQAERSLPGAGLRLQGDQRRRFNRPEQDKEELYPEVHSDKDNSHMNEKVLSMFKVLRENNPAPEGKAFVKAKIPSDQLKNHLAYLQEHSFVLYTTDITPSWDTVQDWSNVILHQQLNIKVTRVRTLNRNCFLISVDNEYDRDRILAATPLFLGGNHMVFALPWSSNFDPTDVTKSKVPVWVELPYVHPGMESFGEFLLSRVGDIIHSSIQREECRFSGIKACIMLDLREELPESIEVEDEDSGESYHQKIVYRSLPNACFHCHERGHLIRNCPARRPRQTLQTTGADGGGRIPASAPTNNTPQTANQTDAEGFTPVTGSKKKAGEKPKGSSGNRFDILTSMEEDEHEEAPDHVKDPHQRIPDQEAGQKMPSPLAPSGSRADPASTTGIPNQQQDDDDLMDITKEAKRKRDLAEAAKSKEGQQSQEKAHNGPMDATRSSGHSAQSRSHLLPNQGRGRGSAASR
ncbi:hypothetical protein R1sor_004747 [Riccia sorocarpa]|uniref:CCHC-type domain-containing protein n=1 Tax=Riccia sorocarpa TaxID=122646 RepID=A0ABD3HJI4_9MARC